MKSFLFYRGRSIQSARESGGPQEVSISDQTAKRRTSPFEKGGLRGICRKGSIQKSPRTPLSQRGAARAYATATPQRCVPRTTIRLAALLIAVGMFLLFAIWRRSRIIKLPIYFIDTCTGTLGCFTMPSLIW